MNLWVKCTCLENFCQCTLCILSFELPPINTNECRAHTLRQHNRGWCRNVKFQNSLKIVGKQNCEHEADVGRIRTAIWKFYYHRVIRHKSAGIDPAQPIEPLPRWFPLIAAVKLQMPPHLVETTRWSPLTPQRSKCPHMSSATPSLHKKLSSQFHSCPHF